MARILCVEDESLIRELLVEELSDAGHEVIEAENGKLGLEAVLTQSPDLVVSDWLMPEMSGGELFTILRSDHPELAELPFIFVSAFADKAHIEQVSGRGPGAYLNKPVDFDKLMATIAELLGPN